MELIVTGGGSGDNTLEIDKLFASHLDKTKPLLYIPVAIDNIKHPYPECLIWLRSTFDKFGVSKYEMWIEEDLEKNKKVSPLNYSGIYIGGGNTPYLLLKLKESGFLDFIEKALKKGVPIYGGSAGAVIFSKTIISSLKYDKNWNNLSNLSGMNLIGNYEITCHFSDKERNLILNLIKENNIKKLVALSEKNALEITEKGIKLIGKEDASLFVNGEESIIKVNSFLTKTD